MIYTVNHYQLDTNTRELQQHDRPQKIEPLIFKLLQYMLENPDRVLARDELINAVWASRIISDSALSAAICAARHALGDTAKKQKCIKTVSGTGYRFIARFSIQKEDINKANIKTNTISPNCTKLPDKPSLAVLDFSHQQTDEKTQFLSNAITLEINSSLARLSHLFVIARASASFVSKQALQPSEIAQSLGVRYLIYGDTKLHNDRLDISISIVDATTSSEIWAEHFNQSLDDIFVLQESLIQTIASVIDTNIELAEIERAFLIPTENLNAWQNYHRGLWHMDKTTIKDVETAQSYFKKAITQDARFSRAHASLGYTYTSRRLLEHSIINENDDDIILSIKHAQKSIDYCMHESMGYMTLGRNKLFSNKINQAIPILEESIRYYPNSCHAIALLAQANTKLGKDPKPINISLNKSERINPHSAANSFNINSIRCLMMVNQKKYDEAVTYGLRAIHFNDSYYLLYAITAGSLQLANQTQKAQVYAKQALKLLPSCSIKTCRRTMPCNKTKRKEFTTALINAGIPKTSS